MTISQTKPNCYYNIATLPIPLRSTSDQRTITNCLQASLKNCKEKKLNSLAISLPPSGNNKEEIKTIISNIFRQEHITIYIHIDTRIILNNPEDITRVLPENHESPFGGQQGITRTTKRIKQTYYWPTITKDTTEYIRKCESCQKIKSSKNTKIPLKITTTSRTPFERVALDIVGPLPISHDNNKYILTFQDDLTKFSEAIAVPNAEANTIARMLIERIVCRFGIPDSILTDQGSNFLSNLFKEVCKILKTRKLQTTPYHPQTNGALERSHKTLAEYLRHYVNQDPLTWDTWLPYSIFVYNTTPHTSTTYSPHELLYGYPAKIPSSLNKNPQISYNYDNYANELKARLQHGYKIAREQLQDKKQKTKIQYDKKSKIKLFNVGDKVLIKNQTR